MSADNYMYVYPHEGKFYVEMRFASCDYNYDDIPGYDTATEMEGIEPDFAPVFDTVADAIEYASNAGTEAEYGWTMSPKIQIPSYADLLRKEEKNPLLDQDQDNEFEAALRRSGT